MNTKITKIDDNDECGDFIWCKKCEKIHLYEKICKEDEIQNIIIKKVKNININDKKNK
jgi:hypothetical protein